MKRMRLAVESLEERDVPATWGGSSGNWSDATKWVGGVVPASGADVTFPLGTGDVTADHTVQVGALDNQGLTTWLLVNSPVTIASGVPRGMQFAVASTLTFSGGVWVGSTERYTKTGSNGSITIDSGTTWGVGTVTIDSLMVTNSGTMRMTDVLTLQSSSSPAILLNYGTVESVPGFLALVQAPVSSVSGSQGSVANHGTLYARSVNLPNWPLSGSSLTITCPVQQLGLVTWDFGSMVYLPSDVLGGTGLTGGGGGILIP